MKHLKICLLALAIGLLNWQACATDLNGQWDHSPNSAWYKKQAPTKETLDHYGIGWDSCCNYGDVCQQCVVHHNAAKPPWHDSWWYEKDGKLTRLPDFIVHYVPWTPTGKPVLFLAPFGVGNLKKGDPVCLKIPGGAT